VSCPSVTATPLTLSEARGIPFNEAICDPLGAGMESIAESIAEPVLEAAKLFGADRRLKTLD